MVLLNFNPRHLWKILSVMSLACLAAAIMAYPAGVAEAQGHENEVEVVFFNPDSGSQNPVDATNALQTFCNVLNKRKGWNLRAYFFKKQKDLERFLDTRKVDLGILSQIFLVENREKRGIVPFCIPVRNGKTTYRKVIIVSRDKGYHELQDLKGKVLAATALGEENVPFYNRVVFRGEIDVSTHFKEIKIVDSANSAIMAVLYGQVDAAAVTMASFNIMQDLNPQVKRKLVSIFTSAETPISPMCYFKGNVDMKLVPELKKILLSMHNDPIGRQSMLAFQVEAWEPVDYSAFKETEEILKGTSAKPTPKPVEVASTAAGKPTPPPVPEPIIKRIQAYEAAEGAQLTINAWVTESSPGPGIDQTSVKLSFSIDGGPWKDVQMQQLKGEKFNASVPLPKKQGAAQSKEINYTVKPGDTLGKIARKYLGSSKKYMVIANYNKIKNPNLIFVDQVLKIKTGETKVTEVKYKIFANDKAGKSVISPLKTKYIF